MGTNYKTFKPFDKVLVRDHENVWQPDLYGFWDKCRDNHTTMTDAYVSDNDILPYEGYEYLVGTTDEPEEEVKLEEGEWLMIGDGGGCFINALQWHLSQFHRTLTVNNEERLHVSVGLTTADCLYAVKFSDFNPNDMEETSRHILCVKNGKIVRYKG